MWGGIYSAKAMTPMTVAMMMFTALSLIESASMPASLSLRTAEAIQRAAAVSGPRRGRRLLPRRLRQ